MGALLRRLTALLRRLAALLLAALVLVASVAAGALGFVRQQNGEDGRWLLLAAALGTGLVVAQSRGRDGAPHLSPRSFFVLFAGGLVGLALVAAQPDTVNVVVLGILGVSVLTQKRTPMVPCAACGGSIKAAASRCRHCGEPQPRQGE